MAIFITRENVINCIRDLTTVAKTGVCKAKTKKNTPSYKHPAKKTRTKHIFSSILKPCMCGLDRGKISVGGFILAFVILAFCDFFLVLNDDVFGRDPIN